MVGTSQNCRKEVEQLATPDSQAILLGRLDSGGYTLSGQLSWDSPPPCPAVLGEGNLVTRYQALGDFPNKDNLVSFPSSFLTIKPKML